MQCCFYPCRKENHCAGGSTLGIVYARSVCSGKEVAYAYTNIPSLGVHISFGCKFAIRVNIAEC